MQNLRKAQNILIMKVKNKWKKRFIYVNMIEKSVNELTETESKDLLCKAIDSLNYYNNQFEQLIERFKKKR